MPKSKKSWVWNYLIDNGKTATCQFCKKEYKSGQGTSTLMYHFNQVHPEKILPTPSKLRDDTLDNLSFLKGIMKMEEPQRVLTYT